MTGLWASSSQCFSILDQTMGKSGWMGSPIDLVTRCNNNQRFPVNGDVFVPCLSLCEPQKEAPLRFPIHGGLSFSLSLLLFSAQHFCCICVQSARITPQLFNGRRGGGRSKRRGTQAIQSGALSCNLRSGNFSRWIINGPASLLHSLLISQSPDDERRRERYQSIDR